jgi:hypothetical protein
MFRFYIFTTESTKDTKKENYLKNLFFVSFVAFVVHKLCTQIFNLPFHSLPRSSVATSPDGRSRVRLDPAPFNALDVSDSPAAVGNIADVAL